MSEREKLSVRLEPELRERLDRCYTMDGSRSRREYIENAIRFYTDYQEMQGTQSLLPKEIATALDGRLGMLELSLIHIFSCSNGVAGRQGILYRDDSP